MQDKKKKVQEEVGQSFLAKRMERETFEGLINIHQRRRQDVFRKKGQAHVVVAMTRGNEGSFFPVVLTHSRTLPHLSCYERATAATKEGGNCQSPPTGVLLEVSQELPCRASICALPYRCSSV